LSSNRQNCDSRDADWKGESPPSNIEEQALLEVADRDQNRRKQPEHSVPQQGDRSDLTNTKCGLTYRCKTLPRAGSSAHRLIALAGDLAAYREFDKEARAF